MTNPLVRFYAALEALNDGERVILTHDVDVDDVIKRAKTYARQRGFAVRLSADGGISVLRVSENDAHTVSKALDRLKDGCDTVIRLGVMSMSVARKVIGQRCDTGLVRYEAKLTDDGIWVRREDLFSPDQLSECVAGLEALLGNDNVSFNVDEGKPEVEFRRRIDLFGMVVHQPFAVMRTSETKVQVFYDRR